MDRVEVPVPIMVTSPVAASTVATSVSEEMKLNDPPLSEVGAGAKKFASPTVFVISETGPSVGSAFDTVRLSVLDPALKLSVAS